MKIAFFCGDISLSGGTERVATCIANELNKIGYEIKIISLYGSSIPTFNIHHDIKTISLFETKKNFSINYIKVIHKLRKIIKSESIDILIDVDTMLSLFSVISLLGLKTKHISWEHFNYNNNFNMMKRKLARKLAAKLSDFVITLTEKDKTSWINNNKNCKKKIIPIPNPVPISIILNKKNNNNNKIIALGNLNHVKGFDRLIDIWEKVEMKRKDWHLSIVGNGDEKSTLEKKISNLNLKNIKIKSAKKNVVPLYDDASIYVMTSRFEGFPMVLLEARARGVPIVSYDCNTGPSELIKDGINGFLIPDNSSEQFVEKLLLLMENNSLRKEMSINTLKDISDYKPDEIVNKYWVPIIKKLSNN